MPQVSAIGALVLYDPDTARERILDAYRSARFVAQDAAEALGISYRQLVRLVDRLGLVEEIDRGMHEAGIPLPPRPPRVARHKSHTAKHAKP